MNRLSVRGNGSVHIRSVAKDIIFTLLTCGLYNLVVQNAQMHAVNDMLGTTKYSFWSWFLLTLVTCGLYHIYHEYQLAQDIVASRNENKELSISCLLLSIFGLSLVADALQQGDINKYYGSTGL